MNNHVHPPALRPPLRPALVLAVLLGISSVFDLTAQPCSTLVTLHATSPQNNSGCLNNFSVEIYVSGFTDLNTLSFSVNWDPSLAHFDNATFFNPGLQDLSIGDTPAITNTGTLTFSWFDLDPMMEFDGVDFPDGLLGTLNFSSNNNGGIATISITGSPTPLSFLTSEYCEDTPATSSDVHVGLGLILQPATLDDLFRRNEAPQQKPDGTKH